MVWVVLAIPGGWVGELFTLLYPWIDATKLSMLDNGKDCGSSSSFARRRALSSFAINPRTFVARLVLPSPEGSRRSRLAGAACQPDTPSASVCLAGGTESHLI